MNAIDHDTISQYRRSRLSSWQLLLICLGGLVTMALLFKLAALTLSMVLAGQAPKPSLPDTPPAPRIAPAATAVSSAPLSVAGIDFVWCPAGEFSMGSPAEEVYRSEDEPQHEVVLSKGFWIASREVTQSQWEAVMGFNPSKFSGSENPVERVSWSDCQEFIERLNARTGKHFRLPTEAEWEYACRAGHDGPYGFAGAASGLDAHATYGLNSGGSTRPAAGKQPNAWGLYDMHGSVWEWCSDWYSDYGTGVALDPQGPASGTSRIIRGGSWNGSPANCRSANRNSRSPDKQEAIVGFRLVMDAPQSGATAPMRVAI